MTQRLFQIICYFKTRKTMKTKKIYGIVLQGKSHLTGRSDGNEFVITRFPRMFLFLMSLDP